MYEEERIQRVEYGADGNHIERTSVVGSIIRCKDCVWSRIADGTRYPANKHPEYVGKTYCIKLGDEYQGRWVRPHDFCSWAERKDSLQKWAADARTVYKKAKRHGFNSGDEYRAAMEDLATRADMLAGKEKDQK